MLFRDLLIFFHCCFLNIILDYSVAILRNIFLFLIVVLESLESIYIPLLLSRIIVSKTFFNPLWKLKVVTPLPSTESRIYSRRYLFLLLLHCVFRDNVLPAMLCYILYSEAFTRSRLPLAHIFLAIFLWKDRTLWISEVATTLKKGCSVSCHLLVVPIFMASDLLSPPTLAVKNSMCKRMLSSSRN